MANRTEEVRATSTHTTNVESDVVSAEIEDQNSRTMRTEEERDAEFRDMEWEQARLLPTPRPQEGIDYRYVRVSSSGTIDNMNHSQALRDRWTPVMAEEVPELGMVISDVGSASGQVVFGGMMLCKRPSWIGDKIRDIADQQSRDQQDAVDGTYLSEQHDSMRKFSDKSSEVRFGGKN